MKKHIYFKIFFVIALIILHLYTFNSYLNIKKTKSNTISVMAKGSNTIENKIEEKEESPSKYKIKVYYPETSYKMLNNTVRKFVDKQIEEFKKEVVGIPLDLQSQQFYTLDIKFDEYIYKNYITYVFHTFIDTGGAHPNTYIHTITYDTNKNKIITISDLINDNKNILKMLSSESYNILKDDKRIKEVNAKDMLEDGTKPTKKNYSNFAFTDEGLKVFFERYQVAPYYIGEFEITIPYNKLSL